MNRPSRKQWIVLWCGAIWIVLVLGVAEDYVVRAVFAGIIITGLLFWQLTPTKKSPVDTPSKGKPGSVREEEATAEPTSSPPSAAIPPTKPLIGVSGWLMLLFAILAIFFPLVIVTATFAVTTADDNALEVGMILLFLVGLAAGSVYTAIAIGRRWPNAPEIAVRFFGVAAGLYILGFFVNNGMTLLIEDPEKAGYTVGQMIGYLAWPLVWMAYLRKSRRVKDTYTLGAAERTQDRQRARIAVAMLALILIGAGALQFWLQRRSIQEQFASLRPHQWVKGFLKVNKTGFSKGFEAGVFQQLQPALEGFKLRSESPPTFSQLPNGVKAVLRYTATNEEGGILEGEVRSFAHSNGIAIISSACVPALVQCSDLKELLDEAEMSLLPVLTTSQLDDILPPGQCAHDTQKAADNPAKETPLIVCTYGKQEAANLTFGRQDADETVAGFLKGSASSNTPAFRRAMVRFGTE